MTTTLLRAACAISLALSAATASAADYNTNLIVNGAAEQGTTGWTTFPGYALFQSVDYSANWVLPTQPGPTNRGTSLFVGGSGVSYAAGFQNLDLSANLQAINAGQVSFALSGWLGGWTNQADNAMLYVTFHDLVGNVVGDATLGPVTPGDRGNQTGLFFRERSGVVPMDARSARINLTMERLVSGDNDGYADNLSLVLTAVPEPGLLSLMSVGLVVVGFVARRQRRNLR